MRSRLSKVSLLWKILLSTSIAVTLLFAVTGWIVQENAIRTTSLTLEDEVRVSFHAYNSLWRSRAELLSSVSLVLSRMSDVRAAFSTSDVATIRDTAKELWDKIAQEDAIFLVTDPRGKVIASLSGNVDRALQEDLPVVRAAAGTFPKQATGFMMSGGHLYQIAVTPVYVQAAGGLGLLNVLVAGYTVDGTVAQRLKQSTGGSEFVFLSGGRIIASTLDSAASRQIDATHPASQGMEWVTADRTKYTMLGTPLLDVQGKTIGELRILRSFDAAEQRIASLRQNIVIIWLVAVLLSLGFTFLLARRILKPVRELDRGAAEVADGNFDYRVPVESGDELGRLAQAFNAMCASIQSGRQELIRQERILTIGRLSTSIVHDLRNPLAAIYGGAEMLIDGDLSPEQVQRLSSNIYNSSRRVQELLQELVNVGRGKSEASEVCHLLDIVSAAYDMHESAATTQKVDVQIEIPEQLEIFVERARMERVFSNLIDNALGVMPDGGKLKIHAEEVEHTVIVLVEDSGPGIAPQIRARLFEPFVSAGKKNGVGLGLALSHQAVLDHGGELWADSDAPAGARFFLKLPLVWGGATTRAEF